MLMCMCDSGGVKMVVELLVRMHSWVSLQGRAAWLRAHLPPLCPARIRMILSQLPPRNVGALLRLRAFPENLKSA